MSCEIVNPSSRAFSFTCLLSSEEQIIFINSLPVRYLKYIKSVVNDHIFVSGFAFIGLHCRLNRFKKYFPEDSSVVAQPVCTPAMYNDVYYVGNPEVYEKGMRPKLTGVRGTPLAIFLLNN